LNYTPTTTPKDYNKIECALIEKNYNLIEEADFFEQLLIGDDWVNNLANHVYNYFFFYNKKFKFQITLILLCIVAIDFNCCDVIRLIIYIYGLWTSHVTNIC
jgi:hypothetical protein